MDWFGFLLTPLLAGVGAAAGAVATTRVTRSGQLWEVIRACSHDLISPDDDTSRLAYNQLEELVRTGRLNRSQRAFARQGIRTYVGEP